MENLAGLPVWVILIIGGIVGYFVVSKIIDFYRGKDGWPRNDEQGDTSQRPEKIGGHDPTKPIG